MWLRSRIAVAVVLACSCGSDLTPSLGSSICRGCSHKKKKNKKMSWMVLRMADLVKLWGGFLDGGTTWPQTSSDARLSHVLLRG